MDVPLREYIETRMDEREKAYVARLDAIQKSYSADLVLIQRRLDDHDEFRSRIDSERVLYVRMDQLKGYHDRIEELERWRANVLGRQLIFGGAVVILAGIVSAVLRMVGH